MLGRDVGTKEKKKKRKIWNNRHGLKDIYLFRSNSFQKKNFSSKQINLNMAIEATFLLRHLIFSYSLSRRSTKRGRKNVCVCVYMCVRERERKKIELEKNEERKKTLGKKNDNDEK